MTKRYYTQTLTTFYGFPVGPYNGTFNLSFTPQVPVGHTFTSRHVLNGDVTNTIPEPASLLLLGSGLIGLGFWRWKNTRA